MAGSRRRIIGLASDDTVLQSLIPFVSTPETARLGMFANQSLRSRMSTAPTRAMSRAAESELPISLAEQTVSRLQEAGKNAFKQQEFPRAIELWGEALAEASTLPAPIAKQLEANRTAQLLTNRCQAYLMLGNDDEALTDAEAACDAAPDWPKAYYRLGTVLLRRHEYGRAHAVLKQGVQLDSTNDELKQLYSKAEAALLASEAPVT